MTTPNNAFLFSISPFHCVFSLSPCALFRAACPHRVCLSVCRGECAFMSVSVCVCCIAFRTVVEVDLGLCNVHVQRYCIGRVHIRPQYFLSFFSVSVLPVRFLFYPTSMGTNEYCFFLFTFVFVAVQLHIVFSVARVNDFFSFLSYKY